MVEAASAVITLHLSQGSSEWKMAKVRFRPVAHIPHDPKRLALSEVTEVDPELIGQLRLINQSLISAATQEERIRRDSEWHRCLVSVSGNQRLMAVLEGVKASIARYEHAYLDACGLGGQSVEEHEHIAKMLEEDPARAAQAIEAHWRRGLEVILNSIG